MISFWVCATSLGGIILLVGWRLFLVRKLDKEEICKGVISSRPFFYDFNTKVWLPTGRFVKILGIVVFKYTNKFVRKYYCRFSDYMHGRHSLEKNGCKGYWNEVNGYKKNGDNGDNGDNNLPG